MKAHRFEDTLKIGEAGFNEVEGILKRLPNHYVALDRQLDKEFMKKDIDFIWIYEDEGIRYKTCELKTDTKGHRTGNMFIEVLTNVARNKEGNYYYTECELFMYYFIESKELYIIPMDDLRQYVDSNKDSFKVAYSKSMVSDSITKKAKGLLVPTKDLKKALRGKYKYIRDNGQN